MSGCPFIDLSGTWQFYLGPAEDAVFSGETVHLPGTMDENRKGSDNSGNFTPRHLHRDFVYTGPAVYQREFAVPADWAGRPLFLCLERTKKTRVWVDGQPAGEQQKSYTTPHRCDLTALCRPGRTHTLTVEVDNSPAGMPHAMYSTLWEGEAWSHQLTEHGQTNWNGIVGELRLESPPALSVTALRLRPDVEARAVRVELALTRLDGEQELRGGVVIQAESWNSEQLVQKTAPQRAGFRFAPGERTAALTLTHPMGENPLLWDEFHPNLYRVAAEVYAGGTLWDAASEDFGMRAFTTGENQGGRQFFINGRPTQLRGEINCAIFPKTGYAPMGLADWLEIFQIYKDYGLNHVRFHTWVPPKAAFRAADQLGLYLYVELPHWGRRMFGDVAQGDLTDVRYYEEDTRRIFAEYRNSPAFVMFALGNEERIGFYYYEEFLKFCKGLEPDLLCSDIAGHSTFPPSADFASKWLEPGYLPLTEPRTDWDYAGAVRSAPVPITGHEVGQLQVYPDYGRELPAYDGVLKPWNLEHFRDVLAQAGLADRAGDFHRATGKLAAMLYRRFAESYLRTAGSGGFLLLGLQDFSGQGTALVGLLDCFFRSKGAAVPEEFRRSCCGQAVLARLPRFVWEAGETLAAEIVVPNYSPAPAELAVAWTLEDDRGSVLASGSLPARPVPQGGVTRLGRIETALPRLSAPCRLRLTLALEGDYDVPHAPGVNGYPLWLYPAAPAPEVPKGVVVRRAYDRAAEEALARGERVVIFSEGTAAALPHSRAVSFRPDFWSPMFHTNSPDGYSLGIFVDENHPLFTNFPTDCFGDWQWFWPLQGARGLLINQLPAGLRPMVQPIASIDLPDRLAMFFEARVGEGRLFVSTLDLPGKADPASRALLAAVYRYVDSEAFQPETALEPEALRPYLPPLDLTAIRLDGKTALDVGGRTDYAVTYFDSHGPRQRPEGKRVEFRSENPAVLQVDEAGRAQAVGEGVAKLTAACFDDAFRFTHSIAVRVGEPAARPIPLEGAKLTAQSSHWSHPVSGLLDDDPDTCWQTDYLDRTQCLPQWLSVELRPAREVCALLCGAWTGSIRGAILRAALSASLDGEEYEEVCRREWSEEDAGRDKLLAFPPRQVRFLRLDVDWAVMHTGDSNAVSISRLALYDSPLIAAAEERPACPVRFGTELERALAKAVLPRRVAVTLADGSTRTAEAVWLCGAYRPDSPGDYVVEGTLFCPGAANPGEIHARQILRVLPKDMTTPPDKRELDRLSLELRALSGQITGPARRTEAEELLAQVESFAALTGAVQHDVDVWAERISEVAATIRMEVARCERNADDPH